jgi:hypothetical protein
MARLSHQTASLNRCSNHAGLRRAALKNWLSPFDSSRFDYSEYSREKLAVPIRPVEKSWLSPFARTRRCISGCPIEDRRREGSLREGLLEGFSKEDELW